MMNTMNNAMNTTMNTTMNNTMNTMNNNLVEFAELINNVKYDNGRTPVSEWKGDTFYFMGKPLHEVEVVYTDNYVEPRAYYGSIRIMSDVWDGGVILSFTERSVKDYSVVTTHEEHYLGNNGKVKIYKSTKSTKGDVITSETKKGWMNSIIKRASDYSIKHIENLNLPCKIVGGRKFIHSSHLYLKSLKEIKKSYTYGFSYRVESYYRVYDLETKSFDNISIYNVELTDEAKEYFLTLATKLVEIKYKDVDELFAKYVKNPLNLEDMFESVIINNYRPIVHPNILNSFVDIAKEKHDAKMAKVWESKKEGVIEWAKKKNPKASEAEIDRIVECVRKKYYA